jgi:hypothetical protein
MRMNRICLRKGRAIDHEDNSGKRCYCGGKDEAHIDVIIEHMAPVIYALGFRIVP